MTNLPETRTNKQVSQAIHDLPAPYLSHFAAQIPRYVRVNTCLGRLDEAVKSFSSRGFSHGDPFSDKYVSDLVKLNLPASRFPWETMF